MYELPSLMYTIPRPPGSQNSGFLSPSGCRRLPILFDKLFQLSFLKGRPRKTHSTVAATFTTGTARTISRILSAIFGVAVASCLPRRLCFSFDRWVEKLTDPGSEGRRFVLTVCASQPIYHRFRHMGCCYSHAVLVELCQAVISHVLLDEQF